MNLHYEPFFFIFCLLMASTALVAQHPTIESKVYRWDEAEATPSHIRVRKHFLSGSSRDLNHLELHATMIAPQKQLHPPHSHDREELIIIKEGEVRITIEQQEQTLGPGSVALIMPGDQHSLTNVSDDSASFYILLYQSKSEVDLKRAADAGGSFMVDWENVPFKETVKGGSRSFFERPTAMLERLEMHVTTLKPGIQSHPPHTHRPAEIILMLEGESQELIDGNHFTAKAGDFYFLNSETRHTIKNIGDQPCTYFAFQFN